MKMKDQDQTVSVHLEVDNHSIPTIQRDLKIQGSLRRSKEWLSWKKIPLPILIGLPFKNFVNKP